MRKISLFIVIAAVLLLSSCGVLRFAPKERWTPGPAIRQGQVCANGIIGVSQGHNVMTNTLIYAALPEFYAILALVAALMI